MLFRVAYALLGPVERALHVWGWGGWVGSSRCFRAKAEGGSYCRVQTGTKRVIFETLQANVL